MASFSVLSAETRAEARKLLRQSGPVEGLNQAYFESIVARMGSDPDGARESASRWKLFADLGDDLAYALRAKAVGERLAGKWAKSAETFIEAGKVAKSPSDQAVFQIGAVDSLARSGDVRRAVSLGKKLATTLERLGEPGQAGRARLNTGNAYLYVDDYQRAAQQYELAAKLLNDAGLRREAAAARLGQSGAELYGGDLKASIKAARDANEALTELGDDHYADLAMLNVAHGELLEGRGDSALSTLLEIAPRLTGSPSDAARVEEFLGDAYMRLNLFEEAYEAYRAALNHLAIRQMPLNIATSTFGLGLAADALGKKVEARKHLLRAAERFRKLGNGSWQGAALSAASTLSAGAVAKRRSLEAIKILKAADSHYHLCRAALSHAERFNDAAMLRVAARLVKARGYHFLSWRIDAARARNAPEAKKLAHWRRMFASLMSERMLTRSTTSRAAYMRDKHTALSEYLAELLRGDKPRIREALSVVAKARSAALIDELLSARTGHLSDEARMVLEELRTAVAAEMEVRPGTTRRRPAGSNGISGLQRRWLQTEFAQRTFPDTQQTPEVGDAAVFIDTSDGMVAVYKGKALRICRSCESMASRMRRLEFEILAPMVGDTDLRQLRRTVEDLRETVVIPIQALGSPKAVVPEGPLWGLPWSVFLDQEVVVLANPGFYTNSKLKSNPRVVVWAHDPGDLPNVEVEVRDVLARFPNATVCRDMHAARSSLNENIDLLHVAGHATSRSDNPMYSAIELADGYLLAAEIAKSRSHVGIVLLNACDTGRISLRVKWEPDGMVRSFLALGAESVVASLWPLDDVAAGTMVGSFYAELTAGKTVSQSLEYARRHVRKSFEHPYYWAPLTNFGGYGRRSIL